MLSISSATTLAFAPSTPASVAPTVTRASAPVMETLEDLKTMAPKLNPVGVPPLLHALHTDVFLCSSSHRAARLRSLATIIHSGSARMERDS